MDRLFTIREISEAIATAESRADADRLALQMKGAVQRGLLNHTDTQGFKRSWRFSLEECIAARIVIAAVNLGVRSDDMRTFVDSVRKSNGMTLAKVSKQIAGWVKKAQYAASAEYPHMGLVYIRATDVQGNPVFKSFWQDLHTTDWAAIPAGQRHIDGNYIESVGVIPVSNIVGSMVVELLVSKSRAE